MMDQKWKNDEIIEQIIDLAYEGIWTLDADGLTDHINERGAAMIGYRPEEMVGRSPKDFMFPGDYDDRFFEQAQRSKVSMLERRLRHKDGSPVWTLGSTRPMFDDDGTYRGGLAMFTDITGRKRAEEALKRSELRFRALVTAGSDFIYRMSPDWSEVYQFRDEEYGPGSDRRTALWIDRYVRPEDRPGYLAMMEKGVQGKSAFEMEHWVLDGGKLIWVFTRAVPILDEKGDIIEWFGMAKDITEQKMAQEALRKSGQRFELLSEANSILLSSREPERVIQSIAGKVVRHLDCDVFFNYIFDELHGKLRLNAYCGISKYAAKEIEWLELGAAICGRVAISGQRIVSEDVQHNGDNSATLARSMGVQAYACHPIRVGERTVGTLSFGTRKRTRFEEDELALMRIVAEQVSVSIKRRRAELAARNREMHLERAQRIARMGSWEWDVDNDRIFFSGEAYRLVGATPDHSPVRNEDALAFVHPEDRAIVASKLSLALDRGAYDIEYRIIRRDGQVRSIRDIGEVTAGGRGMPTRIVGTIQDITESKMVDEALKERDMQLAMAQQIAHMGSWTWDIQKDVFRPSDEAYRIFGMRPADAAITYSDFLSFVHPEDRQRVLQQAALIDRQEAYDIEYRIIRKDGEERHVYSRGAISYGKSGEPLNAVGTVQDITERKRTEDALKESQQWYQALIETNVDFIWEMDPHGRYTYCSPQMEKLWGLKPEDMLGRTPFDMMPPGMREEKLKQFIGQAAQPAGFRGLSSIARDASGKAIYLETSGVPFFGDDGALLGYRGITRDVTEQVEKRALEGEFQGK